MTSLLTLPRPDKIIMMKRWGDASEFWPKNYPDVWLDGFNKDGAPRPLLEKTNAFTDVDKPEPVEMIKLIIDSNINSFDFWYCDDYEKYKEVFNTYYPYFYMFYTGNADETTLRPLIQSFYANHAERIFRNMPFIIGQNQMNVFFPPAGKLDNGWYNFMICINLYFILHSWAFYNPSVFFEKLKISNDLEVIPFPLSNSIVTVNTYGEEDRLMDLYSKDSRRFPLKDWYDHGINQKDHIQLAKIMEYLMFYDKDDNTYHIPSCYNYPNTIQFVAACQWGDFVKSSTSTGFKTVIDFQKVDISDPVKFTSYGIAYFGILVEALRKKSGGAEIAEVSYGDIVPVEDSSPESENFNRFVMDTMKLSDNLRKVLEELKEDWSKTGDFIAPDKKDWYKRNPGGVLSEEDESFLNFIESYPLSPIIKKGGIEAFELWLDDRKNNERQRILNIQWNYYVKWVFYNVKAQQRNDPKYRGPGQPMVDFKTGAQSTIKGKTVVNSCFDTGILEHAENQRPWWFYQPIGFGWNLIGELAGGGKYWAWIRGVANDMFNKSIEILKQIWEEYIVPVVNEIWPYVVGAALVLGTGVIGFHYVEKKITG